MSSTPQYWFPAKRFGWGWGAPNTWQGTLTLVIFLALLIVGAWLFPPASAKTAYLIYLTAVCAALLVVLKLKGEPMPLRRPNR